MKLDPITVEVIGNALSTVVEEMGRALMRASYSANIKERGDCSAAVFDTRGRLIAQAQQIPLHMGSLLGIAEAVLSRTDLSTVVEGDVFIGNDAYTGGGTHLNDIVFFEPVFAQGAIVAWVANIAHHSDFVDRGHAHIFQEGPRIPPIRLYRAGVIQQDILDFLLLNCQVPEERVSDFRAQMASNRLGVQRMQALYTRYGAATVDAASAQLLDYSERMARAGISAIPDGRYAFSHDFDTSLWPELLNLSVAIEIKGDEALFDFTGCPPQTRSGMNMVFTALQACVYFVVKTLIDPATPANSGFHRALSITAPAGSVVNASAPAAVYSRHDISQRLIDMMFAALAPVLADRVPAGSTGVTVQTVSGTNPRNGKFYVYNESMGGGMGARQRLDGLDGVHVNSTNSANIPVEALESEYPLSVDVYELVQDSGGAGQYRGGMAIRRRISPTGHQATVNLGGPLNRIPAWGLDGGAPGGLARIELGEGVKPLSARNGMLEDGQKAAAVTSGGGGFGDPRLRDRDLVRRDLREGRISEAAARDIYGLDI
ncbi:hydantoinase B/oxoprolinase family protein [Ketogulonicigenium vulgare]|uniref:hydantoinase B/oxoprolinase family protein n=1 Tax=Ketogulonicigenium vulgare TaxID=92945 RepID=UPI00235A3D69|nr:hydantoinase B/oxoprolinase family protein [Ketogulonicigenium vulgare]